MTRRGMSGETMGDMETETVAVPLAALRELVEYADSARLSVEAEYSCSRAESEESEVSFLAVIDGLGIDNARAWLML